MWPMVPLVWDSGAKWAWQGASGEVQVRLPPHLGCRNSGGLQMAATESDPHVYHSVSVLSVWVDVLLVPLWT